MSFSIFTIAICLLSVLAYLSLVIIVLKPAVRDNATRLRTRLTYGIMLLGIALLFYFFHLLNNEAIYQVVKHREEIPHEAPEGLITVMPIMIPTVALTLLVFGVYRYLIARKDRKNEG